MKEIVDLERLCGELQSGIASTDWVRCDALLADMRRVTHALRNALQASDGQRNAAFEAQVRERVQRIMHVRDEQIERLRTFHDGVGERLRMLSNWKSYARSVGAKEKRVRSAGLDSLG
ncbi:MAG: hypothetical protein ACYDGM_05450 [Vulcanimicrobiaceae bacterium]